VHLVEKDDKLGGQLNLIYKINFDRIDSKEFLEAKLKEFNKQKNITVYLNSEVADVKGSIGDFKVTVQNNAEGKNISLNVGTIIAATGAYEYKPEGWYHYGENENVLTQLELSEKLRNNELKDGETLVFIHCVGSRQPEGGNGVSYCSLICCSESIRHALYVKETYPNSTIYVLYRDIRVGTDEEPYYWKARENVNYIRFSEYPTVDTSNGTLNVAVKDILTQTDLTINADKVILSTPLMPHDTQKLGMLN
jgi:heterodisulfide reductase subunit A